MPRKVFVSYARQNKAIVADLTNDLRGLVDDVWIDERLRGGQTWWNVVLEQIALADLVVLALSRASAASEACRSEFAYAELLERPRIAVRIDQVDLRAAPDSVRRLQVVDYRREDRTSLRDLAGAIINAPPAPPLPALLPAPPPVPLTYEDRFSALFAQELPMKEQLRMLAELRHDLDDEIHADSARDMLGVLHDRPDTVWQVRDEVGILLGTRAAPLHATPPPDQPAPRREPTADPSQPMPAEGWYVDPTSRFELRYWNGSTWTQYVVRAGQTLSDPIPGS